MEMTPEDLRNMTPEQIAELQKQQCVFCKIVSGEIPSKKVYEDDKCVAVLDINPANQGHVLLLPKEHYAIMPQMPEEITTHLAMVSKALSQSTLKALKSQGTTIFIANGVAAGQKAPHFMMHIIPRFENDRLNMQIPEGRVGSENTAKIAVMVRQKLGETAAGGKEAASQNLHASSKTDGGQWTEGSGTANGKPQPKSKTPEAGIPHKAILSKIQTSGENKPQRTTRHKPQAASQKKTDLDKITGMFK